MRIEFDGTEGSFKNIIRKFTADTSLDYINRISSTLLFNNDNKNAFPGARHVKFPYFENKNIQRIQNVLVNGWALHDLSYYFICFSNDYRGKDIENDEELAMLLSLLATIQNNKDAKLHEDFKNEPDGVKDILLFVYGMLGEQLKYQTVAKSLENAARELFILFECSPDSIASTNLSEIVKEETGQTWENVVTYLFFAWFISTQQSNVLDIEELVNWNDDFSYQGYKDIIKRYSCSYNEIREDINHLDRQILYTKPYVITQKGKTTSINVYLNLFLYEHCIFWIIRDYYRKKGSQQFTSDFGKYFENYLQKLFDLYLNSYDYERIEESDFVKRADWRLDLNGFKVLIEQKSSLIPLMMKQQESDISILKNYCQTHLVEAMEQLEQTERDWNDGEYIKIILVYDDYLKAEVLDQVFMLPNCNVCDDRNYWLVNIGEMERLLYLYHSDLPTFEVLMNEKIKREKKRSNEGRNLEQLFSLLEVSENMFLQRKEVKYYSDIVINTLENYLPKGDDLTEI